ncbi:MAG TPA: hypothetical protein PLM07_21795 [Candidatus Rifleibacterium sp.]|nr:hypothetical protein [Candidatus Rifleibacterium sp.]HPT48527.1 hypothetical protein [Candidatus Rifleibacterium sp.]
MKPVFIANMPIVFSLMKNLENNHRAVEMPVGIKNRGKLFQKTGFIAAEFVGG